MASFTYKALNGGGSVVTGSLDAGDRGEALRQLGKKGLQPVSMSENAESKVSPKKDSGKSAPGAAGGGQ
ncbi:MAG TPA: type II secretory pathway protein, partial [Verrucomicrobiales bacterium]|nr:type II secretory pathway protein [Verrucomicrobiales bacterium]